ncbi:LytTR family DNA-binding domain-containing protein [Flavobacteriaceae bacterium GF1]
MKVLIIEDERLSRNHLKTELNKYFPDISVIGETASVKASIEWLKKNKVDLIFMDVQLSDGLSFEIFKHVSIEAPIIFTTAYDKYAIQAFQENSIGYLLKPISRIKLKNAMDKYKNLFTQEKLNVDLRELVSYYQKNSYRQRISVQIGDRISFININEVAYFLSEETATFAVLKNGKRKIIDHSLSDLEQEINQDVFFRITRNCIVNIESIESVHRYFNSRLKVNLKPTFNGELVISRVRSIAFKNWLDK